MNYKMKFYFKNFTTLNAKMYKNRYYYILFVIYERVVKYIIIFNFCNWK